nr:MAG TPA: hypothetical protein [Caudoviricetes sp.]
MGDEIAVIDIVQDTGCYTRILYYAAILSKILVLAIAML